MAKKTKEYTGSCYIGIVGAEDVNEECRQSIQNILRRKKDTLPLYIAATKGYEARQTHINNWYEKTKHPFILLLDHDMVFAPETLERLRRHKLPYVSGLYMRRRFAPIAPVWFDQMPEGHMPMKPMTAVLEKNKLYPIGASGWGCILIHRDVITATRKLLKGEPEVIEDDMDIYPYDLPRMLKAVRLLGELADGKTQMTSEQVVAQINVLRAEFKPLRGIKDPVGSDIRFPFFARLAGFPLYGDSGVVCQHMLNYPLDPHDYLQQPAANVRDVSLQVNMDYIHERQRIEKAITA